MLNITTHTGTNLPPDLADKCAELLCRNGSEMQGHFKAIRDGVYEDGDTNMQIAVATKIVDDEIVPVGWAAISQWRGEPSFQVFVLPLYRSRGLAAALVSVLTAEGEIPLSYVAVFSPNCVNMAKRCGFRSVACFRRVEDGWIKISYEQ